MSKKVALLQSNYIPWKGYFDVINSVDVFVFLDDVQYTTRDWRSRNRIKTNDGLLWLTIPCGKNTHKLICEVEIEDASWQEKHWNTIKRNYAKSTYFKEYAPVFEEIYQKPWTNLSDFNQYVIQRICRDILGITTSFEDSRKFGLQEKKAARVLALLKQIGASEYLSGPAAQDYLEKRSFDEAGIKLTWMDYSGYPEYAQCFPPFEHGVSIIDLIFNEGPNTTQFMKSFQQR